ncbi:hypothetical protein RHMOL_Rhmol01G0097800 [Rhododendron molle]|uniref:Uncharacterized protein n=1 Tax=Rhododendron molle TaxID=49168 RepID=A0ACC0Q176_RHOML|nr:hypothetical protein RHMOL_Rhmol01G0097800 [Rhododendron molle]
MDPSLALAGGDNGGKDAATSGCNGSGTVWARAVVFTPPSLLLTSYPCLCLHQAVEIHLADVNGLSRYVKTVPLAAEMLDLTRHQKLELVKEIKLEKARYRLEVEIGKSPPLSDEELWLELRHKALELRDERRLANRSAFANILSDMVALLKFTGYKIINNTTDAGKAIILICLADMWLGSHSEVGWHALTEIALEHYGLEVDEAAITIYVCTVPVFLDCCAKLWLFNNLPRLSPKVERIIQDMKWN